MTTAEKYAMRERETRAALYEQEQALRTLSLATEARLTADACEHHDELAFRMALREYRPLRPYKRPVARMRTKRKAELVG